MEQGIILSALLAKMPVGALADGKKLHRSTAECPRSSVSVVAPPIVGICGATNTSKATPHRAIEFGTRINGARSTPNAIVDMDSPDGKIHYCFRNGEIMCVVLPASM